MVQSSQSGEKAYRVVQIEGKVTWRAEELWEGGAVRGPYGNRDFAIAQEEKAAAAGGFLDKLVLKEAIGEQKSLHDAFAKNADGTWKCTSPIALEFGTRTLAIGLGTAITPGIPIGGVDVAKWLDENWK